MRENCSPRSLISFQGELHITLPDIRITASGLILDCRSAVRDPGRLRLDFSAPVSDWVRLRLFDDVSHCRDTFRDYERKRPGS